MVIIGIKHFADISGKVFLLNRKTVITFVKRIKLEALYRLCVPDTKGVDNTVSVAGDRKIIGDRLNALAVFLGEMIFALLVNVNNNVTAELDDLGIFRTAKFKRVTVLEPVIRSLNLEAVP